MVDGERRCVGSAAAVEPRDGRHQSAHLALRRERRGVGPFGDMFCYDVDLSSTSSAASTWSPAPAVGGEPPQPRFGHSIAAVGPQLYVFGGSSGGWKVLSDLHRLDTSSASPVWEEVRIDTGPGLCPSPRAYHAMAVVESVLCVFGGRVDSGGPALNDLWTLETHLTSVEDAGVDSVSDAQTGDGTTLEGSAAMARD